MTTLPPGTAALGAGQPAVIVPLTEDYLLAVAASVLPPEYLDPIRTSGPGYEILQGYAAMWARVSLAIARVDAGTAFLSAAGGAFSTGVVTFAMATAKGYDVTIKAGSHVRAPLGGQEYVVTSDVTITAGLTTGDANIRAIAVGWEYDVRGARTTAAGEVRPGEISEVSLPLVLPVAGAPDLTVSQAADVTGGAAPMLDMLADDRAVERQQGEADPALQARARSLPRVVSPDAIYDVVARYLTPRGIWFQIVRWWETRWQLAYDVAPTTGTGKNPVGDVQPADAFFYDDDREQTDKIWRNRYADAITQGGVAVIVPSLPACRSHEFFYDDPRVTADDHITAAGRVSVGAFDLDPHVQPTSLVAAYDGTDRGLRGVLGTLKRELDAAIAGGYNVFFQLGVGGADPSVLASVKAQAIADGTAGAIGV